MCKVTVAFPVYNVANYLSYSLPSILNQTFKDFELLIVDDKSTDDSLLVIKKILDEYYLTSNVKIISHSVNMGLGEARNTAIRNASGEYILFVDSDDYLSKDCLELLLKEASLEIDIICANYVKVKDGVEIIESSLPKVKFHSTSTADIVQKYLQGIYPTATWNKLYRLEFLKNNDIYNIHRIGEDNYFCFLELLFAKQVVFISDITYYYVLRDNSITQGDSINYPLSLLKALLNVLTDMRKYIEEKNLSNDIHARLLYLRFSSYLIRCYMKSPYLNSSDHKNLIFAIFGNCHILNSANLSSYSLNKITRYFILPMRRLPKYVIYEVYKLLLIIRK